MAPAPLPSNWQKPLPTRYDVSQEDSEAPERPAGSAIPPEGRWQKPLPTMYDLPSEDPEEPGLPDEFHDLQPDLLTVTCQTPRYPPTERLAASDLNLYYDSRHPRWYKRPDWFLAVGVRRRPEQESLRFSYLIWQESVAPLLVVELLFPGTEPEDLGRTRREPEEPPVKWEVYEQILRVPYYGVYDRYENNFRAFQLNATRYHELELPDQRLWFAELDLGLGVWEGAYDGIHGRWLRWYDAAGAWIPTPEERAEQERERAERERQRAEQERERAERERQRAEAAEAQLQALQARLRAQGLELEEL